MGQGQELSPLWTEEAAMPMTALETCWPYTGTGPDVDLCFLTYKAKQSNCGCGDDPAGKAGTNEDLSPNSRIHRQRLGVWCLEAREFESQRRGRSPRITG